MPAHPLLTAMLVMDTLVLTLVTVAAACALRVVLNWSPDDTSQSQLQLQARQEALSLVTSIATWVYIAAGLLLIGMLTNILPGLVPGAMCGTGVLQACHPDGHHMLLLRFLGAVGLLCWQRLETLNRSAPLAPLTKVNARVLLMLLPILYLGYGATFLTLTGLDTSQPVDCCTALYDRIGPVTVADFPADFVRSAAVWIFGATTVGLLFLAPGVQPLRKGRGRRRAAFLLVLVPAWLVSGAVTLVRVLTPYHYEVLHHFCPWCLFLPEHRGIGFPLLLLYGLVAAEAPALWALFRAQASTPSPLPAGETLTINSRRRLLTGVCGFVLLAAGPALWWRWQFGLWLGG